jgi:hypothetical protein
MAIWHSADPPSWPAMVNEWRHRLIVDFLKNTCDDNDDDVRCVGADAPSVIQF